jgi:hypothetical protein
VVGYGWASTTTNPSGVAARIAGVNWPDDVNAKGVIIGGEAHYRHQIKDTPWVFGVSNQWVQFEAEKATGPVETQKLRWQDSLDIWGFYAVTAKWLIGLGVGPTWLSKQTREWDTNNLFVDTLTGVNFAFRSEIALNRDWSVAGQYQISEFGGGTQVQAVTWSLLYRPPIGPAQAFVGQP